MLNQDTQVELSPSKQQQQQPQEQQHTESAPQQENQLQQQQQQQLSNQLSNNINSNSYNKHNPLNDHDYCSPNKRLIITQHHQQQKQLSKSNKSTHLQHSSPSKLPALESVASTSSSPNRKNINRNSSDLLDNEHRSSSSDPPSPSSSSSSSSLSSSAASNKDLIIAQDSSTSHPFHHHHSARTPKLPLEPKDTPSVSKSKAHKAARNSAMEDGSDISMARAKRARQSTSVTDKSEWITGDEQIDSVLSEQLSEGPREKRQRIQREQDSAFTQLSSSDYSSSDAESDQESDYNSEDDPDRLWCICQKPHDGKFMICCDVCKDWFHGHCVGVTKLMGDRFEKQGKEWFCGECQEKLRSGIPRNAILKKRVKGEEKKKKKNPIPGKRGRGRPRKSETSTREIATRSSQRTMRKSSSSLDPKVGVDNGRLRKNLARSDARGESFDEFEDSQRLKELIKERKKEFFFKRQLAEKQKAARRDELGLGRQSITANLSDSLDSLATNTSTPNMSNLPINIKSEHKERSKPNIVLQINTKKDFSSDQANSSSRIVTAIVRSPKKNRHTEPSDPLVDDLFTAEPIQINKKRKANTSSSAPVVNASGDTPSSNGDSSIRKRSNSGSSTSKNDNKSPTIEQGEPSTPKKKRKSSESSTPNGSTSTGGGSKHAQIAQKIKDSLESRSKQIKDLEVSSDKLEQLATDIEGQLSECFKDTQKYLNKFRSLIFNLGDIKNQGLVRNVLTGEIAPARLVRMSPDEMASHELAKWRERENKHSIELIKRDAQLAAQQVIVKKTHKGEEVISAPTVNEPDDPSAVVDGQEPPTTPTKPSTKETRSDGSKITVNTPPASSVKNSSGPLKMKITGITSDSSMRAANQDQTTASSTTPVEDSLPFLDTTKDHKNHVFDMNCKICTKQITEESFFGSSASSKEEKNKTPESEIQPDQPKRLRVSIDTKLDPANLSRLREPLVKPILPPSALEECYSPSRSLQCESSIEESHEDEPYDPEIGPAYTEPISNQPCWSGTITMPDIAKFSASAKPVSGVVNFMREELNENLMVCGRIPPDHVQGYIKKLKSTPKNQILIIQLFPLAAEDKNNFDTFFDYLYSRNRYGVIQTSPHILKDFYILPIHEKSNIPEFIKPIKGPGLDRKEGFNCLIGLLVRGKKPNASTTMASYTPTPIK